MKRGTAVIVLAILLAALGVGWHHQHLLRRARAARDAAAAELAQAAAWREEGVEELEGLRSEASAERTQRDVALAALALASRQNATSLQPALWETPPTGRAEWDPASPYVWLSKARLARFAVSAFHPDGTLTEELCGLLDILPAARQAIETELRRILEEWRAGEVNRAVPSTEHPPQLRAGAGKGQPVTLRVTPDPNLSGQLREQFTAVLCQKLGEQRASMINGLAETALNAEFGAPLDTQEAKVYSVQSDGRRFNVVYENIGGGSGMTVTEDWRPLIPLHLQGVFEQALAQP
jgi:hypothetical protein